MIGSKTQGKSQRKSQIKIQANFQEKRRFIRHRIRTRVVVRTQFTMNTYWATNVSLGGLRFEEELDLLKCGDHFHLTIFHPNCKKAILSVVAEVISPDNRGVRFCTGVGNFIPRLLENNDTKMAV